MPRPIPVAALFAVFIACLCVSSRPQGIAAPTPTPEPDRSPTDVQLTPDGQWAVTANNTSASASLVDLTKGKVVAEVPTGKRPFAVAISSDGQQVAVSNWLSDTITLLRLASPSLTVERTVPVGDEPRGVLFSANRLFVALGGENAVVALDPNTGKVTGRVAVGIEPWHLGLSPNGKCLAVGNTRSQNVSVIDTSALTVTHTVSVRGRNLRQLAISSDGEWAYVPHIAERGFSTTRENIDNGWVTASRISRIPLTESGPREAIALDPRGKAVGDAEGLAISPDGQTLAVAAGGTHELLLLRQPLPFVAFGGPADHIEPDLLADARRFRRVPLGGRPLGARFTPDGKRVVVANYLENTVQVVDVETGSVVQRIALGGSAAPSLARRGEAIFYDAGRSFNQWYSCNTCHPEGHTNGGNFDTLNDGKYGNPKKTLSLRGVTKTGPWTWHGWQTDLRESAHNSLTQSMQGPEPSKEDLDALLAFLATIEFVPSGQTGTTGSEAVRRGEALFQAKGCGNCHGGANYTSGGAYVVGLESPDDKYRGYNPPSLRGVATRSPFLHDGRAKSLEEVLSRYHRASQLTGKPDPTPSELADVIAFLKSL